MNLQLKLLIFLYWNDAHRKMLEKTRTLMLKMQFHLIEHDNIY